MMLFGVNSWIQTSSPAPSIEPPTSNRARPRSGVIRAGLATGLVAFALIAGVARPAETAAFKSESLVCTSIEAGFQYTFDKALNAKLAGDTKGFGYWNNIAQSMQGLWYDAGCGEGSSGGGWQAS